MSAAPTQRRIGPGQLVLVVGPSGAGKDSLIRAARESRAGDPSFMFPSRVVTRPPSEDEDNEAVDPVRFASLVRHGAFALSWTAHGLSYAILASINAALARDCTVICNVSRTVVEEARLRYENVRVIEVTAPLDVLAQRLVRRGRAADADLSRRIERSRGIAVRADVVICNAGPLEAACVAFIEAVTSGRRPDGTAERRSR